MISNIGSIKIKVTQDHIDMGFRGFSYSCPLALAINDRIGDKNYRASVVPFLAIAKLFERSQPTISFRLSKAAAVFGTQFDNNFPVKPSIFVLKRLIK